MVGKLVKAFFPSSDPAAFFDQRIQDLVSYARKVETELFAAADSREEYYHLLAKHVLDFQKEMQAKKDKRLTERQGQPVGGHNIMSI